MHKIFANTLFIGKQFVSLPSCHSTNDVALDMAANNLLYDGAVIHTNKQTKGRGQRGNSWLTAADENLTCSFYLRPKNLAPHEQFELNRVVSLAIIETVHEFISSNEVRIKWPNDIYIADKKVAGILIENSINKSAISQSVIGIGLNINQTDNLLSTATSIVEHRVGRLDVLTVLDTLAKKLEKYILLLQKREKAFIHTSYLKSLYLKGELSYFEDKDGKFKGRIIDVGEEGLLYIEDESGKSRNYQFKEVRYL